MLTEKMQAAAVIIEKRGGTIIERGRVIRYLCVANHERSQSYTDILRGHGCAKCNAAAKKRAPNVKHYEPGMRSGDLEVIEELGVVEGHTLVKVRNVTNGIEKIMSGTDFTRMRKKVLSAAQLHSVLSKNGLARKGKIAPWNSSHTWGNVFDTCLANGMTFLHPMTDGPVYGSADNWAVKCKCGNVFTPKLNNLLSGITRSCGCVKSFAQKEVYDFVLALCPDAVMNERTTISPLELDIYIPSKKIAVEYCGLYWHGEKLKGPEARYKHFGKLKECRAKGIRLITIFEDEWNLKKRTVESFLQSALGLQGNKIGARKLKVVSLPKETASAFLNANHLQSASHGDNLALVDSTDTIFAVALYAKPNASRGRDRDAGEWELSRYCVAPGVRVQGGLSKLIAAFAETHPEMTKLISYSDNRWSEGGVYKATGFVEAAQNPPSYWYFKDHTSGPRKHRYTFRKSEAVRIFNESPEKTEWQINSQHGLDRIWDCGSVRWELVFEHNLGVIPTSSEVMHNG